MMIANDPAVAKAIRATAFALMPLIAPGYAA
jgi:hypothetical protein